MFRRIVFNVLARNCDDHTKNFSFRTKQGEEWTLAPAYDICHAYDPKSIWVSQHALSINGKRQNHTLEDLLTIGKSISIKNSKSIIAEINTVVSAWSTYAESVSVGSQLSEAIGHTHLTL